MVMSTQCMWLSSQLFRRLREKDRMDLAVRKLGHRKIHTSYVCAHTHTGNICVHTLMEYTHLTDVMTYHVSHTGLDCSVGLKFVKTKSWWKKVKPGTNQWAGKMEGQSCRLTGTHLSKKMRTESKGAVTIDGREKTEKGGCSLCRLSGRFWLSPSYDQTALPYTIHICFILHRYCNIYFY